MKDYPFASILTEREFSTRQKLAVISCGLVVGTLLCALFVL